MPFFKIVHTYAERKQIRQFWENMRKEAEKIYDDYTNIKENRFHNDFYKNIRGIDTPEIRPDFFEPINKK
jgi:CRISPR/Cas system-associated endonuclease Cas3-HD